MQFSIKLCIIYLWYELAMICLCREIKSTIGFRFLYYSGKKLKFMKLIILYIWWTMGLIFCLISPKIHTFHFLFLSFNNLSSLNVKLPLNRSREYKTTKIDIVCVVYCKIFSVFWEDILLLRKKNHLKNRLT